MFLCIYRTLEVFGLPLLNNSVLSSFVKKKKNGCDSLLLYNFYSYSSSHAYLCLHIILSIIHSWHHNISFIDHKVNHKTEMYSASNLTSCVLLTSHIKLSGKTILLLSQIKNKGNLFWVTKKKKKKNWKKESVKQQKKAIWKKERDAKQKN